MAEQRCKEVEIVRSQLNIFCVNFKQPNYNPTSVIEKLVKIIMFMRNYDLHADGEIILHPNILYIIQEIHEALYQHEIIHQIINNYVSLDYGLKIGLSPLESDKLKINAYYLLMEYAAFFPKYWNACDDNSIKHEVLRMIKMSMEFALNRQINLIRFYRFKKHYQIDLSNIPNLEINQISVVEQQIYIFHNLLSLQISHNFFDELYIYDMSNVFVELFLAEEYNENDDIKLLFSALQCLSYLLKDSAFSLKFIAYGGAKKLKALPRTKPVITDIVNNCAKKICHSKDFDHLDNDVKEIITKLIEIYEAENIELF